MKSTLFIGATLVASSMAYSMKEATRIRRNLPAFNPSTNADAASDKCKFMSLDELFPTEMLAITAKSGAFTIQDGNNYYGGWTKTVTVPETKAYQYYVTRSDVVVINDDGTAGGWNAIKDNQINAKYEINLCDNDDCNGYTGVPSTTGLQLFDSTDTFVGFDTIVKVVEEMDPDKQPMGDALINKLHGSFTCGADSTTSSSTNSKILCTFYMPQKTWYFGVSSLCHHTTVAKAEDIFAWYVQGEPEQKFVLWERGADQGGGTGVIIPEIVENTDSETDSPAEILFSAPVQGAQSLVTNLAVGGVMQVSWIKKADSTVTYTYSSQPTGSTAPPTRCKTTNSGVSLGVVKDDENGNLVDQFASDCKVSMEASIDVEFSDKYDDSLCDVNDASIDGRQQAQIETTLVQFARIHENRTLPSLQNNTANRFFAAYMLDTVGGQFDVNSGLPAATGSQSDWACLDGDDCAVGDPFIVLGHRKVTVLKADTRDVDGFYNNAATLKQSLSYTISADIEAATLSSPNTAMSTSAGVVGDLTPWSYVMGITDYTISECGAKNFDNSNTFDGEYPTTTGATRRLGSAMPKSVIRKSVINFGSYKGFE